MTNTTLAITAAAIAALALSPAQLLAKPKPHSAAHAQAKALRKVVLMDFTTTLVPARATMLVPDAGGLSLPISDVARQMTKSFNNGAPNANGNLSQTSTQPLFSAAALPNPFITRAIAPFGSIPATTFTGGGSCENYAYQDDFSHGRVTAERRRQIFPLVHQAACEQGLPVGLFDALIMQESRYNHMAISPKGALGLAQLMPGTARQLGTNPYVVMDNLRGGARYLRQQVDRFGRYDLALAAYNAGPGRVALYGRVPAIAETVGYVQNIRSNWAGGRGGQFTSNIGTFGGRRAQMIFAPYYGRAPARVR